MRLARWFVVLLAFAALAFYGFGCSCGGDGGDESGDDDDDVDDDTDDDADDDSCADQGSLGYNEGDTMADFTLYDENGDPLSLYDLCYKVVLIVSSAGWCPHCAQEASSIVENIYEPYHDLGLEIFYTLLEDASGNPPDQAYLRSYKNIYDFPFHVYGDPDGILAKYQDDYPRIGVPFNIVLDQAMVIRAEIGGYLEGTIKYYIEALLGE